MWYELTREKHDIQQTKDEMTLAVAAGVVHGIRHEKRTDMRKFITDTVDGVPVDSVARARQLSTESEIMVVTKRMLQRDVGVKQGQIFKAAESAKQLMGTMERTKAAVFMEEVKARLNQGYRKMAVAVVEAAKAETEMEAELRGLMNEFFGDIGKGETDMLKSERVKLNGNVEGCKGKTAEKTTQTMGVSNAQQQSGGQERRTADRTVDRMNLTDQLEELSDDENPMLNESVADYMEAFDELPAFVMEGISELQAAKMEGIGHGDDDGTEVERGGDEQVDEMITERVNGGGGGIRRRRHATRDRKMKRKAASTRMMFTSKNGRKMVHVKRQGRR